MDVETLREDGHGKTEADIRVILHKSRYTQGHQKLGQAGRTFPSRIQREYDPVSTLILNF